jgi:hypothetical protein
MEHKKTHKMENKLSGWYIWNQPFRGSPGGDWAATFAGADRPGSRGSALVTVVADAEGAGVVPALKVVEFSRRAPFVRTDEDVPHEGALPDLYGLEVDHAIERAIEDGWLRWSVNLRTGETLLRRSVRDSNA